MLILAVILALIILPIAFFPKNTPNSITYEAKIVGFNQTEGPSPIVGVTMIDVFNVTIQNVGKTDIGNMNLTVERLINQTVSTLGSFDYQYENFTLKPGEALSVRVDFLLNLDEMMSPNQSFLAILKTNSTILDERYLA
jgi:hypothetical protein